MARFDETIKKMQDIIDDIKKEASKKLENASEEEAVKINMIANKTIDTIEEASVKLKNVVKQINDEEELNSFLDRVDQKCKQAAAFAYSKFDEIKPDIDADFKKNDAFTKSTMEKLAENENVQNAVKMANNMKDSIIEFINKPETQEKINVAKKSALNIIDKGLDVTIDLLEKIKKKLDKQD